MLIIYTCDNIFYLIILVAEDLKNLIIKLLRKNRKTVPMDKWEHALSKFCYGYSSQDAWEIERFGYKKASLTVKLRVLKVIAFCTHTNLFNSINPVFLVSAGNYGMSI